MYTYINTYINIYIYICIKFTSTPSCDISVMTPDSCAAATHCNTLQHTATHCRAIFTTTPGREISVMTPDSCAAASNVRSSCSKFLKSQLNNLSIAKSAVMVILRCSLDLAGGKSCAYCRHCNTCVKHDLQTTVTHV